MIPIVTTIRFERPPGVSIRQWRAGMKEAHREQALTWHREMLPDHFKPYARFKYQHQPRSQRYIRDKLHGVDKRGPYRKHAVESPGNTDLVFTGRMRDMLVMQNPLVRAYPTRARLDYTSPPYLIERVNRRRSTQPDKWREITTVSADQSRRLEEVLVQEVLKRFENAAVQPYSVRVAA